jgi:hypothetical protein
MNALDPDQMTAAERLAEVADLMAAALIRRQQRKSSSLSGDLRESSLDFSVDLRGHVVPNPNVGAAE